MLILLECANSKSFILVDFAFSFIYSLIVMFSTPYYSMVIY